MAHPVCSFLRSKMKEYLSGKDESVRWLAKQTNLDYSKLYRLESGEAKSFSFFEARKLLRAIDPSGFRDALMEFYPEESQALAEDLVTSEPERDKRFEAIELILSTSYHYEFYLFAAENPDTNKSIIEKTYGTKGVELLSLMLEKGALVEHESRFRGVISGILDLPEEQVKAICRAQVDLVDLGQAGSLGANYASGLNLQGKKALYRVIAQAWREAIAICQNPNYRGSEITVVSLFLGSQPWGKVK